MNPVIKGLIQITTTSGEGGENKLGGAPLSQAWHQKNHVEERPVLGHWRGSPHWRLPGREFQSESRGPGTPRHFSSSVFVYSVEGGWLLCQATLPHTAVLARRVTWGRKLRLSSLCFFTCRISMAPRLVHDTQGTGEVGNEIVL